jgi:hypothetical protein
MIKIGILKVKGLSFLLSFALFFFFYVVWFVFLFVVWLCRFGYGMDEVMMY